MKNVSKRKLKPNYKKAVATHKIEYIEVKSKSRAGVEYTKYKPQKIAI